MTTDGIIFTVLLAVCGILLVSNVLLWLYLSKTIGGHSRDHAGKSNEHPLQDNAGALSEISDEVLLVLLTAAAASALGKKKNTSFRVVSFHRAGRK